MTFRPNFIKLLAPSLDRGENKSMEFNQHDERVESSQPLLNKLKKRGKIEPPPAIAGALAASARHAASPQAAVQWLDSLCYSSTN
jgi:hypothetical protein